MRETTYCGGADRPPTFSGNSLLDWVSEDYLSKMNVQEETPIIIEELPIKTYTIAVDQISETLVNQGYATKELGDKIQNKMKFTKKISTSFNDFGCNDMSQNFFSLPDSEKNVNNFWNKIISRSAVLVSAEKLNNTVSLKVKKVNGQVKKRWAKLLAQSRTHSYSCTVTREDCGYKPVRTYQCKRERVGSGSSLRYENKCGYVTEQQYKCDKTNQRKSFSTQYILYKHEFTDSWNKTEVEDMFASVERQISSRMHF